jgi:UDP-N-acetylglucosamine 2-epimerase (non-hydrolysing)
MPIVLPLHPATRRKLEEYKMNNLLSVTIIEPQGYLDFMSLVMDSAGVITDSGGIQEETAHLGIPCCTIRDTTERPVTVTHGSNRIFPPADLNNTFSDIEAHLVRVDFVPSAIPLWDTEVSKRIIERLL